MNRIYISNAFSLQMVEGDCIVKITEVKRLPYYYDVRTFPYNDEGGIPCDFDEEGIPHGELRTVETGVISAVGHADTARILGIPCNRINVELKRGDVLFVAQLQGGRLPEGATTLPEGFKFKYLKVEIL